LLLKKVKYNLKIDYKINLWNKKRQCLSPCKKFSNMQKFCDTHSHLDFKQFDDDREKVIHRAFDSDVSRIIDVGVDLASSKRGIEIAEHYPEIWSAVGVHPNEIDNCNDNWLDEIIKLARHPKVVAIGEIGLDFYREHSSPNNQFKFFEAQIELAKQLGLPMIIHIRDAQEKAREILEKCGYFRGVLHAFSGDEIFLDWALEKNFYIGFGGPITFKNFKRQNLIEQTPPNRILLETDCPYLAPHPYRGKRNEPANIPLIAQKIAEIKNIPLERLSFQTTKNAAKLFRFPSPYLHHTKKTLGQNFLINVGIVQKLSNFFGDGKIAIEIGPGKGIITEKLVEHFDKTIAVELDDFFAKALSEKISSDKGFVVQQDILALELDRIRDYYDEPLTLIGNIPYSITTPILFWFAQNYRAINRALLIMQKEVAQRICASSGNKTYGIPSVILSRYFDIEKLFDISPKSFNPAPKIISTAVRLTTRKQPIFPNIDGKIFSRLVRVSFAHRRKKLLSNLRNFRDDIDWHKIFASLCIDENTRAEQLDVDDFCRLTEFAQNNK